MEILLRYSTKLSACVVIIKLLVIFCYLFYQWQKSIKLCVLELFFSVLIFFKIKNYLKFTVLQSFYSSFWKANNVKLSNDNNDKFDNDSNIATAAVTSGRQQQWRQQQQWRLVNPSKTSGATSSIQITQFLKQEEIMLTALFCFPCILFTCLWFNLIQFHQN